LFDLQKYLEHLNYKGALEPSEEVLSHLHAAHLLKVPFENLSIPSGEPIILDNEKLFQKIIINNRGGFCYELNGLFAFLLSKLGFNVSMLSANVIKENGEYSKDFDHMTLLVQLEEKWLADVGFGDSFRLPLKIDDRNIVQQGNSLYRIYDEDDYFVLTEKRFRADWKILYKFTLQPYAYEDFNGMCTYHQTSDESHFTKNIICSLAKPDGRITISNNRLIITKDEIKEERDISSSDELKLLLDQYFSIKLSNFEALLKKRNFLS